MNDMVKQKTRRSSDRLKRVHQLEVNIRNYEANIQSLDPGVSRFVHEHMQRERKKRDPFAIGYIIIGVILGYVAGSIGGFILGLVGGIILFIPMLIFPGSWMDSAPDFIWFGSQAIGLAIGGFLGSMKLREEMRDENDYKNEKRKIDEKNREIDEKNRKIDDDNRAISENNRKLTVEYGQRISLTHEQLITEKMLYHGDAALEEFEQATEYLASADKSLTEAEIDFGEKAFAPFWDSIERVMERLVSFNASIGDIETNMSAYVDLDRKSSGISPPFLLSRHSVINLNGVSKEVASRMSRLTRNAQRDFHFASIYEQRKTNKILIAGFQNLADALAKVGNLISQSIDSLTASVDSMAYQLSYSLDEIQGQLKENQHALADDVRSLKQSLDDNSEKAGLARTEQIKATLVISDRINESMGLGKKNHKELVTIFSEAAEREDRVLEKLDNIQNRRRPEDPKWKGKRSE